MGIVVTGGSGFIGSNFIENLLESHPDDMIVNIDKMTYASDPWYNSNVSKKGNYKFVNIDIQDFDSMRRIVKDADLVVNFAAESHVDNSILNSRPFVFSNIVGVHTLLELARTYDFKFHQVSTDEVYGTLETNSPNEFDESTPYDPRNPYSATKASADFLVRAYYNTYGIEATISNSGNNFGPHQHPEKLVPKTIMHALKGKKIPIYGRGDQMRDWIYVKDHCSAIELVIEKGKVGETYVIGSSAERIANVELVRKIIGLINNRFDLIEFVKDRPGHDFRYALNPRKIKEELSWSPKFSFTDGLKETIIHYTNNLERYIGKI